MWLTEGKLRERLLSSTQKFGNESFREVGKYGFVLIILINVIGALGFYVDGQLSKQSAEQALLGFNERIKIAQKSFVPELNENITFLEIPEIKLPNFEVLIKKSEASLSVKDNDGSSSLTSVLQAALLRLKGVIAESFNGTFSHTAEKTQVALVRAELALFENELAKNISAPDVAFLEIAQIELPSLKEMVEKKETSVHGGMEEVSDSVALTLQSAIESVKKVLSQTFEKIPPSTSETALNAPPPIERALFESEAVSNSEAVRAAQNNLAPSLAPVVSSLRAEVARYVELEFAARESVMLATIRASMTRQSDADANRRSIIVNNITQNADFTSPDITGGTITGTAANLASLSGAGLTTCESNNVLTWANGQFGCEADDSGAGGGGGEDSKWATSTPTTDITPNGAIGVVMTRSTTTNATTTTSFASTASSTNLFAASANIGVLTVASCTGCGGSSASSTLHADNNTFSGTNIFQSITRSTTTSATSTNLFATTASSTNLFATAATLGNATIGAITASSFNGLTISGSTGILTIPASASLVRSGGHSLTLTTLGTTVATFPLGTITLADLSSAQTFTGAKIFDSITRSTTTFATTTRFAISSITSSLLKTAADGSLLAATAGTDYENVLTFGDGLTRTANDIDCDTASIAVFGCLLATDWGIFNSKVSTTSIDTITEVETLWGVSNILIESDIDASSELLAIMDDETGSGPLVFGTLPSLAGFISTASSTVIGNFNITGNSTSTNATTTNLNVSNDLSVGSTAGTGDSVFQLANDTDAWSVGYYSADKTFRIASSTNLTSNVYFQIGKSGTTTLSSGLGLESGSDEVLCIDPTTFEITRGGASCAASSLRFKEEIENLSYGLEAIRRLRPVSYQYKESERPGDDSRYLGFIAEEMIEVIPEVVEMDGEDLPGGIDYAKLAPVFAKAMQELYDGALSRVREWLADAANGITSLFAKEVYTEMLCVKKSDGLDVCVTGDQLSALLSVASLSASAPVTPPLVPDLESEPDTESESEPESPTASLESAEPEAAVSTSEPVSEPPAQ